MFNAGSLEVSCERLGLGRALHPHFRGSRVQHNRFQFGDGTYTIPRSRAKCRHPARTRDGLANWRVTEAIVEAVRSARS
jgi:hypothetical protein